jgi:hypothetical protein
MSLISQLFDLDDIRANARPKGVPFLHISAVNLNNNFIQISNKYSGFFKEVNFPRDHNYACKNSATNHNGAYEN